MLGNRTSIKAAIIKSIIPKDNDGYITRKWRGLIIMGERDKKPYREAE